MENETLNKATDLGIKVAKKAAGSLLKTLIMLVILVLEFVAISYLIYRMFPDVKGALTIGIGINLIYMFVCFFVKKVRTKMVIWFGICSLGLTIYWFYLLTKVLNSSL